MDQSVAAALSNARHAVQSGNPGSVIAAAMQRRHLGT